MSVIYTRPDALVVGPMKAGTSWIQDYLDWRGDVCLPRNVKETFFFDHYWGRGLEWYEKCFDVAESAVAIRRMEIGSSYFHSPCAPGRVRSTLGNVPIVVTLRDPVRRAWSHYMHLRRSGYTKAPLRQAVEKHPEIIMASRYNTCLERWYEEFPRANVRFLWLEALAQSPDKYVAQLCDALSLEYRPVPQALMGASNEASVPFSHMLAAMGRLTSHALRRWGFYGAVNIAKDMGLKRIFFGKPGSAREIQPTPDELSWLTESFVNEVPAHAEAVLHAHAT